MKFLNTIVVFLVACSCSMGQSASTILATLRTKGTTKEGGVPRYENYIPPLGPEGTLDYSVIPTNHVFTDVFQWVNENGSRRDQEELARLSENVTFRLDSTIEMATNTAMRVADSAVSNLIQNLATYETDPEFYSFVGSNRVAVGKGAQADANGAIQLGDGTNDVENTLKFRSTVLVDDSGYIPADSAPWAVSETDLIDATNSMGSAKVSKAGDSMTGDLSIRPGSVRAVALFYSTNSITIDGIMTYSTSSGSKAKICGSIKLREKSAESNECVIYIYKADIELDYSQDTANVYDGSFTVETEHEYSVDVHVNVGASPSVTYSVTCDGAEANEYTTTCEHIQNVIVQGVAETVFQMTTVKNYSGLTLNDINTPVEHIDLVSPNGRIFRFHVSDDGDLFIKKLK